MACHSAVAPRGESVQSGRYRSIIQVIHQIVVVGFERLGRGVILSDAVSDTRISEFKIAVREADLARLL
jgi:hypothetical protein